MGLLKKTVLSIAVLLLAILGGHIAYYGVWPRDFTSKSAMYKQEWIYQQIYQSRFKAGSYPSIGSLLKLVAPTWLGGQSFKSTGCSYSDQFDKGRVKGIHSVGWATKFKVNWTAESKKRYTGVFQGSEYGILRISNAKKPEKGSDAAPALSLKFFRDHVPSGDLVAMYKLKGQNDDNFFAHPFSNHLNEPKNVDFALKTLKAKFTETDPVPIKVGSSYMAQYDQKGVKAANPKNPYQLFFVPNPELTKKCHGTHFNGVLFGCVDSVKKGSKLYRIYALDQPKPYQQVKTSDYIYLGEIVQTGGMFKSNFADEQLQFRHVFWNEEMKAVPSWRNIPKAQMESDGPENHEKNLPKWASGKRARRLNFVKKEKSLKKMSNLVDAINAKNIN